MEKGTLSLATRGESGHITIQQVALPQRIISNAAETNNATHMDITDIIMFAGGYVFQNGYRHSTESSELLQGSS